MAFKIVRNDITKVKADIIVNSANTKPICAGYRTDAAIYEAAGYDDLLAARQKIGDIQVGKAAVTPAFKLKAKYIVHTVGPKWVDGKSGEQEALRSCYRESLLKAVELKAKSIAFPLISTGAFKFPKPLALEIATEVSKEFTSERKLDVILVVYDAESFELTEDLADSVEAYIDEHYVGETTEERLKKYRSMNSPRDAEWRWRNYEVLEDRSCDNEPPVKKSAGKRCAKKAPEEEDVSFVGMAKRCAFKSDERLLARIRKAQNQKVFTSFTGEPEEDLNKKLKDLDIQTFGQRLAYYAGQKNLSSAQIYNAVFMDRKHFSKLLSDKVKLPKRETVLALAIGLKLNVLETKDLLSYAGYSFTPYNMVDVIVSAFIERGIYNVTRINIFLEKRNLPQLG